jgi:hypothetical protein
MSWKLRSNGTFFHQTTGNDVTKNNRGTIKIKVMRLNSFHYWWKKLMKNINEHQRPKYVKRHSVRLFLVPPNSVKNAMKFKKKRHLFPNGTCKYPVRRNKLPWLTSSSRSWGLKQSELIVYHVEGRKPVKLLVQRHFHQSLPLSSREKMNMIHK